MTPFKSHEGLVAVLDRANVDTDQIIAKQFLKAIGRTGFGPHLFHDWRYLPDGRPDPSFPLNQPRFQSASILVARNNFGCGSSREHAVWAIRQYGFQVVVAPWEDRDGVRVPGFADIFKNNCSKNALLTIELSSAQVDEIFAAVEAHPGLEASVDVAAQRLVLRLPAEKTYSFELDPSVKERLLSGLDDIGQTLSKEKEIAAFESGHDPQLSVR